MLLLPWPRHSRRHRRCRRAPSLKVVCQGPWAYWRGEAATEKATTLDPKTKNHKPGTLNPKPNRYCLGSSDLGAAESPCSRGCAGPGRGGSRGVKIKWRCTGSLWTAVASRDALGPLWQLGVLHDDDNGRCPGSLLWVSRTSTTIVTTTLRHSKVGAGGGGPMAVTGLWRSVWKP